MLRLPYPILFLTLSMSVSACFKMPVKSQGQVSVLDGTARAVTSTQLSESKSKATMDPAAKVAQLLSAPSGGSLSGSNIVMQPGTLSVATDLVIEEASALSETSLLAEVGLSSDVVVQNVGAGLIVRPTENVSLTGPLTITMEIPGSVGLKLQSTQNLAVFYKQYVNGALVAGVIPGSLISPNGDGTCSFAGYFGAYWVTVMSKPVVEAKAVATVEPIVNVQHVSVIQSSGVVAEATIVAKAAIPEVSWSAVKMSFDVTSRTVILSGQLAGGQILTACKADAFKSTSDTAGLSVVAPNSVQTAIAVSKSEAHNLYGRFRCYDAEGRTTISPWSSVVEIPALLVVAPTESVAVPDTSTVTVPDATLPTTTPSIPNTPANMTFSSLTKSAEGANGYINNVERLATDPLWILNASGQVSTVYTSALNDTAGTLVCGNSHTYDQATIPVAVSITSDGAWSVCVQLTDSLGGVVYGKGEQISRDVIAPTFSSLALANAASDGHIIDSEKLLTNSMWTLTAAGQSLAEYTLPLSDTSGSLICDDTKTYDQTTIPAPYTLSSDGSFAICVRLTDAAGNTGYGKSAQIVRDTVAPTFTSLSRAAAAAGDGYINITEKLASAPMWSLSASGQDLTAYTQVLDDTGNTLVCDGSKTYGQSVIAGPSDLNAMSDDDYAICVKLSDNAGNISYGKSEQIFLDTSLPPAPTFSADNEANDGYINRSEKDSTMALYIFTNPVGTTVNGFTSPLNNVGNAAVCSGQSYGQASIPTVSSLTADGVWVVCVSLSDTAGNTAYFKADDSITRDIVDPTILSMPLVNLVGDNFISLADSQATAFELVAMTSSSDTATQYFSIENDSATCDVNLSYSTMPFSNDSSISAEGKYKICGKATDAAGNIGYYSSAVFVVDKTLPVFGGIDELISLNSEAEAMAFWGVGTDSPGTGVISYEVCQTATPGACAGNWTIVPSNVWNHKATGLTANTEYYFSVRAKDAAGNYDTNTKVLKTSKLDQISSVATGGQHSCALTLLNTVKCWGKNSFGQLGDGSNDDSVRPVEVAGLSNVTGLALGKNHSCALVSGTVYCWGQNNQGQLGNGGYSNAISPVQVSGISSATQLALGGEHSCAVLSSGTIACWGNNAAGQLGDSSTTQRTTPVTVTGITGATAVALGSFHSCAISSGSVECWGLNDQGQLGNGNTNNSNYPVLATSITSATSLALGDRHSCASLSANTAKCWGFNDFGQLGTGSVGPSSSPVAVSSLTTVASVSAGQNHSCARLTDGSAACWGQNSKGQLGDGTSEESLSPTAVQNLTNVISLSSNFGHNCALLNDNKIKCWGENSNGQLGIGAGSSNRTPVSIDGFSSIVEQVVHGAQHSCARFQDGTAKCWGSNAYGQLGDGTNTDSATPIAVAGLSSVNSLAIGADHTCALMNNSSVKCWGANSSGQLGDYTYAHKNTPTMVAGGLVAITIAAGLKHNCAIASDNTVKCWGENDNYQLGNGSQADSTSPTATNTLASQPNTLALGGNHSCALLSNGNVQCWGANNFGQLGNGNYNPTSSIVSVNSLSGVLALSAGTSHSCAVANSGINVYCWGANAQGQLGDGTNNNASSIVAVSGLGIAGDVASGGQHTCATSTLSGVQSVKCWGANLSGQLADGMHAGTNTAAAVPGISQITRLSSGFLNSSVVLSDGSVRCWGESSSGQCGASRPLSNKPEQSVVGP